MTDLSLFERVLQRIRFEDWKFGVRFKDYEFAPGRSERLPQLCITVRMKDHYAPAGAPGLRLFMFTFWVPDNLGTEDAILRWIMGGVTELAIHHAEEQFLYNGRRVFDPHASDDGRVLDVDYLRLFQRWRDHCEWSRLFWLRHLPESTSCIKGLDECIKRIDDEVRRAMQIVSGAQRAPVCSYPAPALSPNPAAE